MNVWMVNHYAVAPTDPGGTRHYSLARQLQHRGHQAAVIASGFDHATGIDRLQGGESRVQTYEDVKFYWVKTPPYRGNNRGRVKNMLAFARAVARSRPDGLLGKPDVIIGSSPHPFAALAALRLARRYRVPFVMEVRDLWPASLVDLAGYSPRSPIVLALGILEKYLYKKATRIIALLPQAREYMESRGGKDKVVWIPNGIDLSFAAATIEPPQAGGPLVAMYAGTHGVANGLDTVLDAAKLVPEVRIRLLGEGPEKPRLQKRAADEGIANVDFLDPVPKAQVASVLSTADAFLMQLKSSPVFRWGISPNKLWDYMAAGRPVIFAVDSSNDPVRDADAGVRIPPNDAAALAEALRLLRNESSERRAEMGANARRYVEANHDFRILGEKLEAALCAVVNRTRTEGP